MKFLFLVLITPISSIPFQQTEIEYSCDPVINDFVIENKVELSQIQVEELATYEVPLQKAIFRSWSPDKKRSTWLEKLRYVQNSTSFSTRESDHFQKLTDHISEDYFLDDKIQKANANNLEFANEWVSFAKTDLDDLKNAMETADCLSY